MKVYQPTEHAPWNVQRVVHLHRRAGFAATWQEVQRDLRDGPNASIDRLLAGQAYTVGVPADFEKMSQVIQDAAVAASNPNRLKAWWLYRMIFSPDPLTERLTLLWHNHFATSNLKVANVDVMRQQNEIFRRCARQPFGELLEQTVKHPAILLWLDADSNRKQHPNENLARELMELFSLGEGHYVEEDVRQAARALTGWTTKNGEFRDIHEYHDEGEKTLLGQRGAWHGDDVLRIVLEHPATAERLARRLGEHFFGEGGFDDAAVAELANGLRGCDLDVGWAVETILRSELFFSARNIGTRVLGPVELIVGAVRALEIFDPPSSTLVLGEWTARLGQDLFYPPNVFGWPGGRDWISTRSMINRVAFASQLAYGALRRPETPVDVERLSRHCAGGGPQLAAADFAATLLAPGAPLSFRREICDQFLAANGHDATPLQILNAVLASPEAQLG